MAKEFDISVVGLSCVDCIAEGSEPRWTVQNPVGDVRISAGGLGNALVALSGLDLKVGVSTRVGDDMYGNYLIQQWRTLGIDLRNVITDPHRATGFSFIVSHGSERTPFYSAGANSDFSLSDIPAELCENSKCVLLFFAGALPSLDGEPMLEFVKRCHAADTIVIMDVCDGTSVDYSPIRTYLPYVDLVVNMDEGARITGKESPEEMLAVLGAMAQGAPFMAVTRPDGVSISIARDGKREYMDVPSPFYGMPVRNVVGAGDAFRAGLASYISTHYDDYTNGRLDYRELCLFASAISYTYLSRVTDIRPFGINNILRLVERG